MAILISNSWELKQFNVTYVGSVMFWIFPSSVCSDLNHSITLHMLLVLCECVCLDMTWTTCTNREVSFFFVVFVSFFSWLVFLGNWH